MEYLTLAFVCLFDEQHHVTFKPQDFMNEQAIRSMELVMP